GCWVFVSSRIRHTRVLSGWSSDVCSSGLAQVDPRDPLVRALTNGAPVRKGKVTLVLPQLADNGNSVPIRITVDSPMTPADHVKRSEERRVGKECRSR